MVVAILAITTSCAPEGTDSKVSSSTEPNEPIQSTSSERLPISDPAIPEGDYKMSKSRVTKEQLVHDIESSLTTVDRYYYPYTPWNLDNFEIVYATVLRYGCPNLLENGSVDKRVFDYLVKITFTDGIQESTQDFGLLYEDYDEDGVYDNTAIHHSGANIHEELNGSIPVAPPRTEGYPFYSSILKLLPPELSNYSGRTVIRLIDDDTKAALWERGQGEVEYCYLAETDESEKLPVRIVFRWNDEDAAYVPCEVYFNNEEISDEMEGLTLWNIETGSDHHD